MRRHCRPTTAVEHVEAPDTVYAHARLRLLHLCGVLTLALNTAEPLLTGHYDRACLDTIAPLLLLGWGRVGPAFLAQFHTATDPAPHLEATTASIPASSPVTESEPDPAPAPAPAPAAPVNPAPEPLPVATPVSAPAVVPSVIEAPAPASASAPKTAATGSRPSPACLPAALLDPTTYDYAGAVLFNAHASAPWARFTIYLRREIAARLGLTQKAARAVLGVSFAKVAEYQKRGLVHFHTVIRLDGPHGSIQPPTASSTVAVLADAIRAGDCKTFGVTPDHGRCIDDQQQRDRDRRAVRGGAVEVRGRPADRRARGSGSGRGPAADR
ncbi:replication initiator [Streptomyces subrutilus]|uniref:replication initiator n=1 Tax=Streptomyces subrutilus TaxID=36818 RepID=UPI003F4CDE3D